MLVTQVLLALCALGLALLSYRVGPLWLVYACLPLRVRLGRGGDWDGARL